MAYIHVCIHIYTCSHTYIHTYRLGRLLARQVKDFYLQQHKSKRDRLEIIRDVLKIRLEEAEGELNVSFLYVCMYRHTNHDLFV